MPKFDEVHISVAFTYDLPKAEWLYKQWQVIGVPVKMGGPALNEKGGEFIPGRYLKTGYTITSRGCPNRCPHCGVPEREGFEVRELPIKDGWNVLDDNLLACSDSHVKAVFEMLKRQERRPEFTGGLEAKILKPWHIEKLKEIRTKRMYFAYDTPDDLEPLINAGKMLQEAGYRISDRTCCCYVLIGYKGDAFEKAEKRLKQTIQAGFVPYAMLYKDKDGNTDLQWRRFQREWCNPTIVGTKLKQAGGTN